MKTILLVEDDHELSRSLREALMIKGYHIIIAWCYQEALQLYQSQTIDMVILDIQLPDGNGMDLCLEIRKESNIPILFLTASDSEDQIVEGLNNGGDDYITKPFRIKELYARINALLRRTNKNQSFIKLGDYYIDILRYEVTKNNQIIHFSPIDFEILKLMALSPEQVFTRAQLLSIIENNNQYYIEDNTLSVHMKRLRDKLGTYKGVSYIETVRGIGYRIHKEVIYGNK